jgi:hypothetical protein
MGLLALENVFSVLEPWLLGRAIDGLIAREYLGLAVFLVAANVALAIAIIRRRYDTRVFGRIFAENALEAVERENAATRAVGQVTARVSFVKEFTDFFEVMFPAAIASVAALVGAVLMLAAISPLVCAATVAVALLIGSIFWLSRGRMETLNAALNDEMERQVEVLDTRESPRVSAHLSSLVRWRVLLSDIEARNFGAAFAFTILLTAFAAWVLIAVEDNSEGQVFAALTYVLQFSQSVIVLPYTYQEFVRTREIGRRLGGGASN